MSPLILITLLCACAVGVLVGFIGHGLTGSIQTGVIFGTFVGMPVGVVIGAMVGAKMGA